MPTDDPYRSRKRINWIHLDFKGVMPNAPKLVRWLDWLTTHGFNGVVLEYEDRLPWRTWPGTFRPGLSLDHRRGVIAAARDRGLEVVPLIQTHGHLEWLLKHPRWAAWRENGCWNELCPQHEGVLPAIETWLDEVLDIHGQLNYLHIGGDETWNLATCPRCRAIAESSTNGKLEIYLQHLGRVVNAVTRRGVRPLIWADMFWREKRMDLVEQLPHDVLLCDWQYNGPGPWTTASELGHAGHRVLGCSAVRCSYDLSQCIAPQQPRIDNVTGWRQMFRDAGAIAGLIHTFWGRSRSLMPLYGPWEGWLTGLLAAAEPRAWDNHPLAPWVRRLDDALSGCSDNAEQLANELDHQPFDDPQVVACRRWWVLALRWRAILSSATAQFRTYASLSAVNNAVGVDPDYINHRRIARSKLLDKARQWEEQVRAFFEEFGLSDTDEFIASRLELVAGLMDRDWAGDLIPAAPPRTAR